MARDHSYEEIRAACLDILSGRETGFPYETSQYVHLSIAVAELFARWESKEPQPVPRSEHRLSSHDANLFLEVFWELFRQNIITIGLNESNINFPFFRVTQAGKRFLNNEQVHFFHDVSTYEKLVKTQIPAIKPTTLIYLTEAMQAFRSECILASTVMLGVAAEDTFLTLLDVIDGNAKHERTYAAVKKERQLLQKINKFRTVLNSNLASLPDDVKDDLETQLNGIQSLIRTFRNDSGHPSGKLVDREQAYVLLNLFIPYAKKVYQLIEHFGT